MMYRAQKYHSFILFGNITDQRRVTVKTKTEVFVYRDFAAIMHSGISRLYFFMVPTTVNWC